MSYWRIIAVRLFSAHCATVAHSPKPSSPHFGVSSDRGGWVDAVALLARSAVTRHAPAALPAPSSAPLCATLPAQLRLRTVQRGGGRLRLRRDWAAAAAGEEERDARWFILADLSVWIGRETAHLSHGRAVRRPGQAAAPPALARLAGWCRVDRAPGRVRCGAGWI